MEKSFTKLAKKGISLLFAFAVMVCMVLFSGQTAYAATSYTDAESNDSHEDAQLVSRNAQTASQAVSGSTSVYRYVTGTLSYDVSTSSSSKTFTPTMTIRYVAPDLP